MEQILAFVLGVSAALLVWGVVVAFKTASRVKQLDLVISDIFAIADRREEMVNRRIDQEIDRTNNLHMDNIKHTDSRVDKLEAKIINEQGLKQVLKG